MEKPRQPSSMYGWSRPEEENQMIEVSQLKEMESLKVISEEALTYLAGSLQKRSYQDKEPVFNEGTLGGDLYLVGSGSVKISKRAKEGEAQSLAVVNAGGFVGIMTFLSGGQHSANASAHGECALYLLDILKDRDQHPLHLREGFDDLIDVSQIYLLFGLLGPRVLSDIFQSYIGAHRHLHM
jgi:CRP-like cAMP-binding protein